MSGDTFQGGAFFSSEGLVLVSGICRKKIRGAYAPLKEKMRPKTSPENFQSMISINLPHLIMSSQVII